MEFTVDKGLKIQEEQLNGWKTILIEEVYLSLEEYIKRENSIAKTGYDIKRGIDFNNYIVNYILGHRL